MASWLPPDYRHLATGDPAALVHDADAIYLRGGKDKLLSGIAFPWDEFDNMSRLFENDTLITVSKFTASNTQLMPYTHRVFGS